MFCRLVKHYLMDSCWMYILLGHSISTSWGLKSLIMILKLLTLITSKISSGCLRYVQSHQFFIIPPLLFSFPLSHYHDAYMKSVLTSFSLVLQNDISDVLDLTFSIDADEEKLILYERTEVIFFPTSWNNFSDMHFLNI